MNIRVTVDLVAGLRSLTAFMGPQRLAMLNEAAGEGVREETRDHLQGLALSRHATAERLGAAPSGHLAMAARAVEGAPLDTDATGATLTINHIGLIRAFQDVHIVPVAAKALAIPVDALAYNRRPGQFGRDELFVLKAKSGKAFLAKKPTAKGEAPQLMYLLVRSVTQPQDRTLLPSDEAWSKAAGDAAAVWFDKERESLFT